MRPKQSWRGGHRAWGHRPYACKRRAQDPRPRRRGRQRRKRSFVSLSLASRREPEALLRSPGSASAGDAPNSRTLSGPRGRISTPGPIRTDGIRSQRRCGRSPGKSGLARVMSRVVYACATARCGWRRPPSPARVVRIGGDDGAIREVAGRSREHRSSVRRSTVARHRPRDRARGATRRVAPSKAELPAISPLVAPRGQRWRRRWTGGQSRRWK